MNKAYWIKWGKAAGIRAVKTMAQAAVAVVGTGALISEVNWVQAVSAAAVAGALSLLTSISGLPEVEVEEGDMDGNE